MLICLGYDCICLHCKPEFQCKSGWIRNTAERCVQRETSSSHSSCLIQCCNLQQSQYCSEERLVTCSLNVAWDYSRKAMKDSDQFYRNVWPAWTPPGLLQHLHFISTKIDHYMELFCLYLNLCVFLTGDLWSVKDVRSAEWKQSSYC